MRLVRASHEEEPLVKADLDASARSSLCLAIVEGAGRDKVMIRHGRQQLGLPQHDRTWISFLLSLVPGDLGQSNDRRSETKI